MLGNNNQPQSGIRTFFGPKCNVSTVFGSNSNMFTVVGSGHHDGTYFRNDNMIPGPDGIHTIIGDGPMKTVWSSRRESHTIIESDFGGTVL